MKNRQDEIIREALRRGQDPAMLTPKSYQQISISVRTRKEVVADGLKAIGTSAVVNFGLRVSEEKFRANLDTCRTSGCGKHRRLVGGSDACDHCGCSAQLFEDKLRMPFMTCPLGYWSNIP